MGMFDIVYFNCTKCGERIEAQSKGGECTLAEYHISEVPLDVAGDANRHPVSCKNCGAKYRLEPPFRGLTAILID